MAEYDAFGRKQGDNPLEQLGSGPVPQAGPPGPQISAPPPSARRSSAIPLGVGALAVLVLAVAGAAFALISTTTGEQGGGAERATPAVEGPGQEPAAPPGQQPPQQEEPARAPQPAEREPASLLRRPELERALRALRAADLGSPVTFRLAAERIDVQIKTSQGRLRNVQVRAGEGPREISISPPGFNQVPTFRWQAIDAAAPPRLIRAAAERSGRSAADVDYLVLMSLPEPTWGLFFKGGMHFQGDATGKILRRVS